MSVWRNERDTPIIRALRKNRLSKDSEAALAGYLVGILAYLVIDAFYPANLVKERETAYYMVIIAGMTLSFLKYAIFSKR